MPSEHPKDSSNKKILSQMAADIGRGYIEFRFTDNGTSKILWCLVSLSCHQTDCPRSVRNAARRKRGQSW